MTSMIAYDEYDAVLASRILGKGALKGGMPMYKYISNRFLTFAENVLISEKFSEYHTGYRAWSRKVLERLPLLSCSDDIVFDNEMLVQAVYYGFRVLRSISKKLPPSTSSGAASTVSACWARHASFG
jgi:hypothetical protein